MTSHDFPADDVLDRAVTTVRDRGAPDRPPAALLDCTVAAVDAAARARRPWPAKRLGRPLAAIAAAATLATAAAVMIAVGLPFGTGGGSVFAAMLDKVREMKSVRYRVTFYNVENAGPSRTTSSLMLETPDRQRSEDGPRVEIFGREGSISLDLEAKTAITLPAEAHGPPSQVRPDLLDQFRDADGGLGEPIDGKQVGWSTWVKTSHEVSEAWEQLREAVRDLENKKIQVHYLGKGLKAGDGSKMVAWWKAEQPGRAIAIYDDFRWREIDEPAAPKRAAARGGADRP